MTQSRRKFLKGSTRLGIGAACAAPAAGRRPALLHLSLTNWLTDRRVLVEVEKVLGPDYVAVRPDHLPLLYKEWRKTAAR